MVCVVLIGGLVSACGSGGDGGSAEEEVTVVDPRLVQLPDGRRAFSGTLVNSRSSAIEVAQVEIALYNDQGGRVETMRIQVDNIPPGDSTQFKGTIDSGQPFSQAQVQSILTP